MNNLNCKVSTKHNDLLLAVDFMIHKVMNFCHIDTFISETSEQNGIVETGREGDGGHW